MRVDAQGDVFRVELTAAEAHLLRRALERACFIDTPVSEQGEILAFCHHALELLPAEKD